MKKLTLLIFTMIVGGCSAAGVPHTNEPMKKLSYCYDLLQQGRPLPAEKLGKESLDEFTKSGNQLGMAEANLFLSQLYKDQSYRAFSSHFKDYDPTNERSIRYGEKSVSIFKEIGSYIQMAKAQFGLANAYLDSDKEKACSLYQESKATYKIGETKTTGESFMINPAFKTFYEMVDAFSNKYCDDKA